MKNREVKRAAKPLLKNKKVPPINPSEKPLNRWYYYTLAIAVFTFITYWPNLKENGFTNKDDNAYVYDQPLIKSLSPSNIQLMFNPSTVVGGNYTPLVMLSLATDYSYAGLEPKAYHATNLLLHILNSILIFFFFTRLTRYPWVGFITALLFAVHPLHVESVVWSSERKDVLYVFFYLIALLGYLTYLDAKGKNKYAWFALVIISFLLSLLSKGTAVTLPLVLIGIDYYKKLDWNWKLITEKVLLISISIGFGFFTYVVQKKTGAMEDQELHHHYSIFERLALGCYALGQYLWKFFLPVHLCSDYPYPPMNSAYPFLLLIPIVVAVFWFFRKNRDVMFGLAFFFVNILLLLQFIPVGSNIIAERYSYLSYTGLFFIAAVLINNVWKQRGYNPRFMAVTTIFCVYLIFFSVVSSARILVWHDSESLWTDLKKEYPDSWLAYGQLGGVYSSNGLAYTNRGDAADAQKSYLQSIDYYTKAIDLLKTGDTVAEEEYLAVLYINRANEYIVHLQNPAPGMNDCNIVLERHPKVKSIDAVHARRGFGYIMQHKYDSAGNDFNRFLALNTNNPSMNINLGNALALQYKLDSALVAYDKDQLPADSTFRNENIRVAQQARDSSMQLRAGQFHWMLPQ